MQSNIIPLTPRHTTVPAEPDRAVYTVAEVAHLLSLGLGGTYALVRTGEIPGIKLGGRWVIPKARFHTWLDELPDAAPEDVDPADRPTVYRVPALTDEESK